MTDEERVAVAKVRLRLIGVHTTWITFVSTGCDHNYDMPEFIEQLADELEVQMYDLFREPR